jgi:hypothetical protein
VSKVTPTEKGQSASAKAALLKARATVLAAKPELEIDLNEVPINVINDRLDQAHATLDLLHTAMAERESAELFIETLNWQTLSTAIYSVMLRIREAQETAGEWHSRRAVKS